MAGQMVEVLIAGEAPPTWPEGWAFSLLAGPRRPARRAHHH